MISVKQRLISGRLNDVIHGIFFILMFFSIPALLYYEYIIYQQGFPNKIIFAAVSLTLLFSLTTFYGLADYGSQKKTHKGTFERFVIDINPARESMLGRLAIDYNMYLRKDTNSIITGIFCWVCLVPCIVFTIYGFVKWDFWPLLLVIYNIFLLFVTLEFGGSLLNEKEVTPEELKEFDKVEDLSGSEKTEFKNQISKIVNDEKEGIVKRVHILKIAEHIFKRKAERQAQELLDRKKEGYKEFLGK